MMFMSLMIAYTVLFIVWVFMLIGFILLAISANLSRKSRKAETLAKYKSKKLGATVTLIISIFFFIPYGLLRNYAFVYIIKDSYESYKKVATIENKVYVD